VAHTSGPFTLSALRVHLPGGGSEDLCIGSNVDDYCYPGVVAGGYIAYEHAWKEWKGMETMNLRSTFLWSFVDVSNFDFQASDSYNKTHRFAVNLVFSPAGRVDVGLEYINGSRENKDGQRGTANQIQAVTIIRF